MSRALRAGLVVLFITGVFGLARGQNPGAASDPEIQSLIQQLSSPDAKVQQAAQEKLLTMGDKAREALEAHVRAKNAAANLLAKLDASKVAGATLVSLDLKDVTVPNAFAELSKQTGFDIQLVNESMMRNNPTTVNFTADKQPFWQVMRDLCTSSGVGLYGGGWSDRKIRLYPGRQMGQNVFKSPFVLDGAFMITLTGFTRTTNVDLSNPQNVNRNLMAQMHVFVEPKVRVVGSTGMPELDEAIDDKGNSLVPSASMRGIGPRYFGPSRGAVMQMSPSLACPASLGEKLVRMKGKLRFNVQTRSEVIEFTDLFKAQDVSKTAAGRRVVLKEFKKNTDRGYQATLVFYRDGIDQQVFYESMNGLAIRLADAEGREWQGGHSSSNSNGEQYEMRYSFYFNRTSPDAPEPGEPTSLTWEVPTGTQEIVVPFEFKDLPLP